MRRYGWIMAAGVVLAVLALPLLGAAWWFSAVLVDKYVQEGCLLDCGDVWTMRGIALIYTALALLSLSAVGFIALLFARRSGRGGLDVLIALVPAAALAAFGYVTLSDISFEATRLAFPPLEACVIIYPDCEPHDNARITVPDLARHSCGELESLRPLEDAQQTTIYFDNETDDVLTIEWIGYESRLDDCPP